MSFSKVLGVHVPIFYFSCCLFTLFFFKLYIHSFYYIALQFSVYYQSGYSTRHKEFVYITNLPHQTFYLSINMILVVLFIFSMFNFFPH